MYWGPHGVLRNCATDTPLWKRWKVIPSGDIYHSNRVWINVSCDCSQVGATESGAQLSTKAVLSASDVLCQFSSLPTRWRTLLTLWVVSTGFSGAALDAWRGHISIMHRPHQTMTVLLSKKFLWVSSNFPRNIDDSLFQEHSTFVKIWYAIFSANTKCQFVALCLKGNGGTKCCDTF